MKSFGKSLVVTAVGALVLSGCSSIHLPGSNGDAKPAATVGGATMPTLKPVVSEEVAWVQTMLGSSTQSAQIAHLAATNTANPAIQTIGAGIESSQNLDIKIMQSWLATWKADEGQPVALSGALTSAQLTTLTGARDAAFDQSWTAALLASHKGQLAAIEQFKPLTTNTQILKYIRSQEEILNAEINQLVDLAASE